MLIALGGGILYPKSQGKLKKPNIFLGTSLVIFLIQKVSHDTSGLKIITFAGVWGKAEIIADKYKLVKDNFTWETAN